MQNEIVMRTVAGTAPSLRDCKRLVYECGPWNPLCPDGDACVQRASQQVGL